LLAIAELDLVSPEASTGACQHGLSIQIRQGERDFGEEPSNSPDRGA
jgi:hypothetical protein